MSGSGISWAICKSASRSRQITMPVPHHSSFFTGRMPFLPPNQQRQSTEGTSLWVAQFSILSLKGKAPELSTPNSLEIWRRQELGILAYFDTKVKRCHSIDGRPFLRDDVTAHFWQCPHSMRSRVYVMVRCPSVCLSHLPVAAACSGFAAVVLQAGDIDQLLNGRCLCSTGPRHGIQQQMFSAYIGSQTQTCCSYRSR